MECCGLVRDHAFAEVIGRLTHHAILGSLTQADEAQPLTLWQQIVTVAFLSTCTACVGTPVVVVHLAAAQLRLMAPTVILCRWSRRDSDTAWLQRR